MNRRVRYLSLSRPVSSRCCATALALLLPLYASTPAAADPVASFALLPTISATATTSQDGDGLLSIAFQTGSPAVPIDLTGITFSLQWHPVAAGTPNIIVTSLSAGQYLSNGGATGILSINIPQSRLRILPVGTYVASLVANYNGATDDLGLVTITHSALGPSGIGSLTSAPRNAATATSIGYVPGPPGPQGIQGPPGAQGAQGPAGQTFTDLANATGTLAAMHLPAFAGGDISSQAGSAALAVSSIGGNAIGSPAVLTALGALPMSGGSLTGPLKLPLFTVFSASIPTVVDAFTNPPTQTVMGAAGPYISFNSISGHLPGDTERTEWLQTATSVMGPTIAETTSYIEMQDKTGFAYSWQPNGSPAPGAPSSFTYPAGAIMRNAGSVYTTTAQCSSTPYTSGMTYTGPSGTASGQTDGTCTWNYVGPDASSKTATLISASMYPGGGPLWGNATDVIIGGGALPYPGGFIAAQELDITNYARDCPSGGDCAIYGLFINGDVVFPGTAGIFFGGASTASPRYHLGIDLNLGSAGDIGIQEGSGAAIGMQETGNAGTSATGFNFNGTFSSQAVDDQSTVATFMKIEGAHSFSGVLDTVSNTAFNCTGTHAGACVSDSSTTPTGISLGGTYSFAQISGKNFGVDPVGNFNAASVATPTYSTKKSAAIPSSGPGAGLFAEYVVSSSLTNPPGPAGACSKIAMAGTSSAYVIEVANVGGGC